MYFHHVRRTPQLAPFVREAPRRQFEPDAIDSFQSLTFLIGETLTLRLSSRIGQKERPQLRVGVEPG